MFIFVMMIPKALPAPPPSDGEAFFVRGIYFIEQLFGLTA